MRYISLFSGAGGADLGLNAAGFVPIGFCEIDPTASDVLKFRCPGIPNYGDVCGMAELVENGTITDFPDAVWMSPPCQDLSVAGDRAGLTGERSGLFFDAIRFVRALIGRGWRGLLLMEQVPGLLSSHGGRDFAEVLRNFQNLGALDVGWRVLDGQFFGVPQRRRRIFFVVDLAGRRAGAILSLADGVSRHTKTRRKARAGTAGTLTGGFGAGGADDNKGRANHLVPTLAGSLGGGSGHRGFCDDLDRCGAFIPVARTLSTREGLRQDESAETLVCTTGKVTHTLSSEGSDASEDGTGRGTPIIAFNWKASGEAGISAAETVPTIGAGRNGQGAVAFSGRHRGDDGRGYARGDHFTVERTGALDTVKPPAVIYPVPLPFDPTQITNPNNRSNPGFGSPSHSLPAHGHPPVVAFQESESGTRESGIAGTLRAGGPGHNPVGTQVRTEAGVRRLMPIECEELMGWAPNWTRWGYLEPEPEAAAFTPEQIPLFWEELRPSLLNELVEAGLLKRHRSGEAWTYLARRVRLRDGREVYEISDSARYQMCGNGVISNCSEFVAARVEK